MSSLYELMFAANADSKTRPPRLPRPPARAQTRTADDTPEPSWAEVFGQFAQKEG